MPETPAQTLGAPSQLVETATLVDRLLRESKFVEARAVCQQVYESATDAGIRALALRGLGETYKEEKTFDQAIEVFGQVVKSYPQTDQVPWARLGLAECYYYKAMYTGQVRQNVDMFMPMLERFLAEHPSHERICLALFMRGWGHEMLGDKDAALQQYQKAVDDHPRWYWCDHCARRIYQISEELGAWDEAMSAARRYMEVFPDRYCADAHLTVAMCYMRRDNLAQAIEEFDQVLSRYSDSRRECGMALLQKATCQRILGQRDEARATLERLIRDYAETEPAIHAKEYFVELVP